ncbi:Bifunctional purine biosynthesis protein PurH, partial [Coemansia sp. RSA 2681]
MLPRYGKAHNRCSGAKARSASGNYGGMMVPRVFAVDMHEVDSGKFQDSRNSGFSSYVFVTVLLVSISALSIGWSLGIAGASKLAICLFQDEDPSSASGDFAKHIMFSDNSWSVAIGTLSVGGLIGAMSSGAIADRIGRRNSLVINNGFFLAGSVWMATATTAVHFTLGRLVMGIGCGVASNVANTYVAEISPIGWRGFYGSFFQLAIMLGALGTQFAAMLVDHMQWRVVVAVPGIVSLVQIAMLPLRVESPSYLIKARHVNEARHALLKLRSGCDVTAEWQECLASLDSSPSNVSWASLTAAAATTATATTNAVVAATPAVGAAAITPSSSSSRSSTSGASSKFAQHPRTTSLSKLGGASTEDASDSETTVKCAEPKSAVAAANGNGGQHRKATSSIWQMLCGCTRDDLRHLVACNMGIMCLQQLCGVYMVLFSDSFSTAIVFDPQSPLPSQWATVVACMSAILAGVFCMFKADTLGRRPLLLASLGGMCACSVLISVGLFYGPSSLVTAAVVICCFLANMGVGAIPWFYMTDSTPAYARSAMTMLGCSLYWCLSIIVGLLVPLIECSSSQWLFVIYGCICALGLLFVIMFVPETANRTTADIVKEHSGSMHFVIGHRPRTSSQFFIG